MAAILVYDINQTKHIDTKNMMDLTDENPANSSLYMINASVNALDIEYDKETDAFSMIYPNKQRKKIVCLDNRGRQCLGGHPKQKHLEAGVGTIVMAIPPDVAMATHQIHDVDGWTIVFTNRGLSNKTKSNAENLDELLSKLSIK